MPPVPADSTDYGAYYYSHDCGIPYERNEHWMSFFGAIADRVARDLAPTTMLDAGCAMGLLVEQLFLRGIDVQGIDISEYAIGNAPEAVRDRCRVASLTEPIPGRFDLVISIEVIEHLDPAAAEIALDNLCAVTDTFLFSSSPYDYGEPTHINVRPPEQWVELFARRGFYRDLDFDASFLTDWAVLYRRRTARTPDVARDYERALFRTQTETRQLRESVLTLQSRLERIANGEESAAPKSASLEQQLAAERLALLDARDTIIGLETRLGNVTGERDLLAGAVASREAAMLELQSMRNSRVWRAISLVLAPLRRLRAR